MRCVNPYHSWERGLNENTNGLIRQYIPKGKDIDDLSDEDVAKIIGKINSRPRKCLGFKTPNQLFLGPNGLVAWTSSPLISAAVCLLEDALDAAQIQR